MSRGEGDVHGGRGELAEAGSSEKREGSDGVVAAKPEADDRIGVEDTEAPGDEGGQRARIGVKGVQIEGDHGPGGQGDEGGSYPPGCGARPGVQREDHVALFFRALGKGGALYGAGVDDGSGQRRLA